MRKPSLVVSLTPCRARIAGFTRMETFVVVAIVLVLIVIAIPIYSGIRKRQHKQVALEKIKLLGSALTTYAGQNAGLLPAEDAGGDDTWRVVASPAAKDVWYNALPKTIGRKGAGDYSPEEFYTDDNLLYLPGANYPDKKKFLQPQFAVAYNTKLQRKDAAGKKERLKISQISDPSKTVALLEQGLLNEDRTLPVQTKTDYDGSPKGSAKSFVGRYDGEGVLCFFDGHVQLVKAADLLTNTGAFPFPQGDVVWTATPAENPNKDSSLGSSKKKK
jgi:type II secretory pathway pseudopilin PulG